MRSWWVLTALWLAPNAVGQEWSPAQREIIDVVVRCNNGWVRSLREREFRLFEEACPETPSAVFWYTGAPAPVRYGGDDGMWSGSLAAGAQPIWRDLVPKAIDVDGDVALIYFDVLWIVQTPNGERLNPSRRLVVMRRVDGQWRLAGGTVSAVSSP